MSDSQHLQKVQLDILNGVAPKLKTDGILVYSTCTILDEENKDVYTEFLRQNSNFRSVKVKTDKNLKLDRKTDYLEIFPDDFDSDGFFISAFQKVK